MFHFEATRQLKDKGPMTIKGNVVADNEKDARFMAYAQLKRLGAKGFTITKLEETNDNS